MLIQRDTFKDVKTCPICKGYGVLNPSSPSYEFEFCEECEGYGTYIDEEKGRIVFGLPLFVDFATRRKLQVIKTVGIIAIIVIILISLVIIF